MLKQPQTSYESPTTEVAEINFPQVLMTSPAGPKIETGSNETFEMNEFKW